MNPNPKPSDFGRPTKAAALPDGDVTAEQMVLAHCLVRPEVVPDVVGRLRDDEMSSLLHRHVLATMRALAQDGRSASVEAISAAMGNPEVEGGTTLRRYLQGLVVGTGPLAGGMLTPLDDAIETVRDASARIDLHIVGSMLQRAPTSGGISVADIATDAVAKLDDVLSSMRVAKRMRYDAAEAGKAALDHMDGSGPSYCKTGFVDLDNMLGGWPRGQLTLIAGRPGAGKSAIASSCFLRAGKAGYASLMFSLEMTREQLGARMCCDLAFTAQSPIHYESILKRQIDERGRDRLRSAASDLANYSLEIEEQRGLTISEIVARMRKHAASLERHGEHLEIVFIDHIGLVRASQRYAGNRANEMGEITDALATVAKELDLAVVGLSQLNRAVEGRDNKRPVLSDLRESGNLEQDASAVLFAYRPAYYLENQRYDDPDMESMRLEALERDRHKLEVGVAKNRNGRVGVVDLWCDIGANAIRNAAYGR